MNDSTVTSISTPAREWLLLIHQIPPKPDYFRVKVRRRLERLGSVALKNSVYVLPMSEDTTEDFTWLAREIRAEGGEATLCRASLLDGIGDTELEEMFRSARDADYAEVERMAGDSSAEADLERARRRLAQVRKVDFFESAGRERAERAVTGPREQPQGALWVTRPGVKVDRMASGWLIRRFIDPAARFAFDPRTPGLRFDTYEGEYTHEGDRCTFEVLLQRFALDDLALREVGEVVHDVDCKDGKFERAEAPGIAAIVDGIAAAHADDAERLRQGAIVFEGLYQRFRTESAKA